MKAWEEFLLQQEDELGADTVKKWLRTLHLVKFDACNLYLEAKDSFHALWFEEHIRKKVLERLENNNNKKIRVHLSIVNRNALPPKKQKNPAAAHPPSFQLSFDPLDPFSTFDNFVVEDENSLPFRLLKDELSSMNPIYLCGPSGAGKSHLLMAVAKSLRDLGKKTIYVRTETFTDHVVNAIRLGEMGKFREAYRNVDALFLDDAQSLSRKGATQEELFHTFNALHMEGKTILIGANCYPKDLIDIEPRLVSRFEWGIVLPIFQVKEKKALLERKAKSLHYLLPAKVAEFLIESFPSNPKSLIHAFEALVLRSHINKTDANALFRPMTVQLAKHYLADLLLAEAQSALTPQKIIQCCSDYYGIRPEDILSKAQTRDCAEPRQLAMYLCRKTLKLPFTKIGEVFGRDHSTVMTSVKLIQVGLEQKNGELVAALSEIEKKASVR